ncbi:hypothetical protein [Salsuginibacillus kocurii]|uniref:hypothetical protein n=1 Tax=Salsuginibacillus kocurii TaxID=427078 RepID=UPI00036B3F29|nr:hypothetical protein [Salsuginibacillus kocurii]
MLLTEVEKKYLLRLLKKERMKRFFRGRDNKLNKELITKLEQNLRNTEQIDENRTKL